MPFLTIGRVKQTFINRFELELFKPVSPKKMFLLKVFIGLLFINKGSELGWSLQEEQTGANFVKLTGFRYIC